MEGIICFPSSSLGHMKIKCYRFIVHSVILIPYVFYVVLLGLDRITLHRKFHCYDSDMISSGAKGLEKEIFF